MVGSSQIMPPQRTYSSKVVSRLASTWGLGPGGMAKKVQPALRSTIRRGSSNSSLGRFNKLPIELVAHIFNLLDFRSLSRVLRVSLRGKAIVEGLPVYQLIMEHAPTLLPVLAQTHLISFYSGLLILQILRSDQCVSCYEFGGFIFLPTCERICFECLRENAAFSMITPDIARKCFHLTSQQLTAIPIMYRIYGSPSVDTLPSRPGRTYRSVSVKQAKQLAIEVHGSPDKVSTLPPAKNLSDAHTFKRFREVSLEPPGQDLSRLPGMAAFVGDNFAGVASMRFPYISDTEPDLGRMCEGCRVTNTQYEEGILPASVLSELVPPGIEARRPLTAIRTRLYSRDGFLKHIEHCYGAQQLLVEWELDSS